MKLFALALFALAVASPAMAKPLHVVAAESVYGDIARQIGGEAVEVVSIMTNPDQDPHLYEASPQTAKALAAADVAIANGGGYDGWMEKLMAAVSAPNRRDIVVAALVGAKPGDNPHLWYAPATARAAAKALTEAFVAADAQGVAGYKAREAAFLEELRRLDDAFAAFRAKHKGAAVAATEPVFGLAADALGLDTREREFAWAVMNGAEPSPSQVAGFERDLQAGVVKALIYNSQASEPAVERLVALAREAGVPVVGVTETLPPGRNYQQWVRDEVDALDAALK